MGRILVSSRTGGTSATGLCDLKAPSTGALECEPKPTRNNQAELIEQLRTRFASPVSYVVHPDFLDDAKHQAILDAPELQNNASPRPPVQTRGDAGNGRETYLHKDLGYSLSKAPLLNREQERALFQRFNFLKYQMTQLQAEWKGVPTTKLPQSALDKFARLESLMIADRNSLIEANDRLVVSVASKYVSERVPLDELMAEGAFVLLRSVDLFDCNMGFKFSTYATTALKHGFKKFLDKETVRTRRYQQTELPDVLTDECDTNSFAREQWHEELQTKILQLLATDLKKREVAILTARFGLGVQPESTLQEVGDLLRLTRERVRQIEAASVLKLQASLPFDDELMELLPEQIYDRAVAERELQFPALLKELCSKVVLSMSINGKGRASSESLYSWLRRPMHETTRGPKLEDALDLLLEKGVLSEEREFGTVFYSLSQETKDFVQPLRRALSKTNLKKVHDFLDRLT